MDKKSFKQQLLESINRRFLEEKRSPLFRFPNHGPVFGTGNPDADLVFVGEGPGREEDLQGKPFVGRSGKLLDSVLTEIGIRREDTYITNVVKLRPPNNRTPTPIEIQICKALLMSKELKILQPKVVCSLGACALTALTEKQISISRARGRAIPHRDFTIIPTFHPAYILRNPAARGDFTEDVQKAAILAQLINQ